MSAAETIALYSEFQTVRKVLANDVPMLRDAKALAHPGYDLADTGRTTCAGPNIQALRKLAGIRECFVPDEGNVFIQCDYPSLELYTLAQWCMTTLGTSVLGDTLNADRDVHMQVAATMLGITYDEAEARKKEPEIKAARQSAKPVNFGLPGGLGAAKLAAYARKAYGVDMTEDEAREIARVWKRTFPEMAAFFALAAEATNNTEERGDEKHLFTGRYRGKLRYSEMCNGRFQGLGADCAKAALYLVTRECFAVPTSPLYGWHPVAFVHDEIIAEGPVATFRPAARRLAELMRDGANPYLPDMPMKLTGRNKLESLAMSVWSKDAVPVYNESGELAIWSPKSESPTL
jgi:DNA polymerase-1